MDLGAMHRTARPSRPTDRETPGSVTRITEKSVPWPLVLPAAARNAVSTPFSWCTPFSRLALSLSFFLRLSFSPFSPEVTTSTPASGRKRGRYREENDVLRNAAAPKLRRGEGPMLRRRRRRGQTSFTPPSLPSRPVPLSFTTRHDHGDAVRTRGRRWRRPSPGYHSRSNNNHRGTRVIGTRRRGPVVRRNEATQGSRGTEY